MVITNDMKELRAAIEEDDRKQFVALLLSGTEDSSAGQVHSFLEDKGLEPWRKYFLITDLAVLDERQRKDWFGGANTDRYAVLKRTTKEVVLSGPILDLLDEDGQPDILKIRPAFGKGRGGNK